MIYPSLFVAASSVSGRGVFTDALIGSGTIVEISPVIVMSREERKHLDLTRLHDYIFEWGPQKEQCCMALGYLAVYNHAYRSNCEYEMDFDQHLIRIKSVRDIRAGEELLVNYNGNWDDDNPVWFDVS